MPALLGMDEEITLIKGQTEPQELLMSINAPFLQIEITITLPALEKPPPQRAPDPLQAHLSQVAEALLLQQDYILHSLLHY